MSVDPLPGEVSSSQTMDRFVYASDDPINRADPDGAEDFEVLFANAGDPALLKGGFELIGGQLVKCQLSGIAMRCADAARLGYIQRLFQNTQFPPPHQEIGPEGEVRWVFTQPNFYLVFRLASLLSILNGGSGGTDWAWWKGLALSPLQWRLPSIGTGSCYAIFLDTVTGSAGQQAQSIQGVADKVKQYGPPVANALSTGLMNTAVDLRSMLRSKTLDPTLGPAAIATLTYAASAVSKVGPYAVRAGAYGVWGAVDVVLSRGVAAEAAAAWKGNCHP